MAKRAVCVGINNFKDPGAPALAGCVNDARNMAQTLIRQFGFDPNEVRTLVNQQATKTTYLQALDWLVSGAQPGDHLVLFTSSHGSQVPDENGDEDDGEDEVLITHDHDWEHTVLIDDELAAHFARLPRGATMVCIWDTCHSGTMEDIQGAGYDSRDVAGPKSHRSARLAEGITHGASRSYPMPDHHLARFSPAVQSRAAAGRAAKGGGRKAPRTVPPLHPAHLDVPCVSISACNDEETAADAHFGGMAEGAFTHCFLEAIHAVSGDTTWEDLHARTLDRIKHLGFAQTPQIHVPESLRSHPVFGGRAAAPARSAGGDMSGVAALDQQIMALEQAGNWKEALAALQSRVQRVPDPGEKVRTLEHVVSIYRVKLGDEAGAVRAAEQVLAFAPAHEGARAFLQDAYARHGDKAKLQALQSHGTPGAPGARAAPAPAQHPAAPEGPGMFGAAVASVGAAAAGVFHAVTSAPVAYEQPGVPHAPGQAPAQAPPQAQAPAAPARPAGPHCAYCGAALHPGSTACPSCGAE